MPISYAQNELSFLIEYFTFFTLKLDCRYDVDHKKIIEESLVLSF